MADIQRYTQARPGSKNASPPGCVPVEPEHADRRVIRPVEHRRSRGEIIQLLGRHEVARVEDKTEKPGNHPHVGEHDVVWTEGVRSGYVGQNFIVEAVVVGEEIADGKESAEGLLDS